MQSHLVPRDFAIQTFFQAYYATHVQLDKCVFVWMDLHLHLHAIHTYFWNVSHSSIWSYAIWLRIAFIPPSKMLLACWRTVMGLFRKKKFVEVQLFSEKISLRDIDFRFGREIFFIVPWVCHELISCAVLWVFIKWFKRFGDRQKKLTLKPKTHETIHGLIIGTSCQLWKLKNAIPILFVS